MELTYDGGGLGKGGAITLFVDGKEVGKGRVERTIPMIFSGDETTDVGKEAGSPVSPDYGPTGNAFSGELNWVQIDLEKDGPTVVEVPPGCGPGTVNDAFFRPEFPRAVRAGREKGRAPAPEAEDRREPR